MFDAESPQLVYRKAEGDETQPMTAEPCFGGKLAFRMPHHQVRGAQGTTQPIISGRVKIVSKARTALISLLASHPCMRGSVTNGSEVGSASSRLAEVPSSDDLVKDPQVSAYLQLLQGGYGLSKA